MSTQIAKRFTMYKILIYFVENLQQTIKKILFHYAFTEILWHTCISTKSKVNRSMIENPLHHTKATQNWYRADIMEVSSNASRDEIQLYKRAFILRVPMNESHFQEAHNLMTACFLIIHISDAPQILGVKLF